MVFFGEFFIFSRILNIFSYFCDCNDWRWHVSFLLLQNALQFSRRCSFSHRKYLSRNNYFLRVDNLHNGAACKHSYSDVYFAGISKRRYWNYFGLFWKPFFGLLRLLQGLYDVLLALSCFDKYFGYNLCFCYGFWPRNCWMDSWIDKKSENGSKISENFFKIKKIWMTSLK